MAKTLLAALALTSVPSALAFRNTSPFFLFSTADLSIRNNDVDIASADHLFTQVTESLSECPSKTYIIVRQDGVSSADYLDGRSAPRLGQYLSGKNADIKSTIVVPDMLKSNVVVQNTPEIVASMPSVPKFLRDHCGAELLELQGGEVAHFTAPARSASPMVVVLSFPEPGHTTERSAELSHNDAALEKLILDLADSQDYTVIYATYPGDQTHIQPAPEKQHTYEMEDPFGEAVHMELKRDLSAHKRAAAREGGLFEKYQYFSPAIFMGLIAFIPLFLIIFFGMKALSSLEVSYFAFSKEMGPSAQRKQ